MSYSFKLSLYKVFDNLKCADTLKKALKMKFDSYFDDIDLLTHQKKMNEACRSGEFSSHEMKIAKEIFIDVLVEILLFLFSFHSSALQ